VAIAFIRNPKNKPEVNHKGKMPNKKDNQFWMLEWATSKENSKHSRENNLQEVLKGEKHYNAKLTQKQVDEIRSMYPQKTISEIAKDYGDNYKIIRDVVKNKTWRI